MKQWRQVLFLWLCFIGISQASAILNGRALHGRGHVLLLCQKDIGHSLRGQNE